MGTSPGHAPGAALRPAPPAQGAEDPHEIAAEIHALVEAGRIARARDLLANLDESLRGHRALAPWARFLAPPQVRVGPPGSATGMEENVAWLREHAVEYRGEWVAVRHGRLLDHAPNRATLSQRLRERNEAPGALMSWCGPADDPA